MEEMKGDKGSGLIIHGALIIPDLSIDKFETQALAIKHGRIVQRGDVAALRAKMPGAEEIALNGYMIIPGLINAHTHVSMSFFRGLGQAQSTEDKTADASMIENFFFPAERALDPTMIEALSYPYLIDALRSGSTACVDAYFFVKGVGKAAERLGMRAFIGEHIADLGGPHPAGLPTWYAFRDAIENWEFSSRVRPIVYAHATDTVSAPLLRELGDFAKSQNLPFQMHLSQTWGERARTSQREGVSPVRFAYDSGVIGPRSQLVHLVSADTEDLKIIKGEGALVALCPISEIIYEQLPELRPFFELDLRLALGTDCAASHDTADMLFEAKAMSLFARQAGVQLGPENLGRMVAKEAAECFANGDIGTLDVGKSADLVCIRIGLELEPMTRPLTNLIFSAAHRQVEHVMIDGEWVLWKRDLVKVSERDLREEFSKVFAQLKSKVGKPFVV